MVKFIASRIEKAKDEEGVYAAQDKYSAYFINTKIYSKYQEAVNNKLIADGYKECIVK